MAKGCHPSDSSIIQWRFVLMSDATGKAEDIEVEFYSKKDVLTATIPTAL